MDPDNILNEILKYKNLNIFIIRHAESEANSINSKMKSSYIYKIKYKKYYKNEKYKDSNLTGLGKFQTLRLKNFLINNNIYFDHVYCSPLIRTLETAYSCFNDSRDKDKLISNKVIINPLLREIIKNISDLPNDYNITHEKIVNILNYKNFDNIFYTELIEETNRTSEYPPKREKFSKNFDIITYKDYINVKKNCVQFWNELLIKLRMSIMEYDNYEINIALYSHNGFLNILQKELVKRYSNKSNMSDIYSSLHNTEVKKLEFSNYNEFNYNTNNKIVLSIKSIYKYNNRI